MNVSRALRPNTSAGQAAYRFLPAATCGGAKGAARFVRWPRASIASDIYLGVTRCPSERHAELTVRRERHASVTVTPEG